MVESYGLSSQSAAPVDNLVIPGFPQLTKEIVLVSGQNLVRGAVLGKINASGKYTLSLSASSDGSEIPDTVLHRDSDASSGDLVTDAIIFAAFNKNDLTLGAGHSLTSIEATLRGKGLYLQDSQQE